MITGQTARIFTAPQLLRGLMVKCISPVRNMISPKPSIRRAGCTLVRGHTSTRSMLSTRLCRQTGSWYPNPPLLHFLCWRWSAWLPAVAESKAQSSYHQSQHHCSCGVNAARYLPRPSPARTKPAPCCLTAVGNFACNAAWTPWHSYCNRQEHPFENIFGVSTKS